MTEDIETARHLLREAYFDDVRELARLILEQVAENPEATSEEIETIVELVVNDSPRLEEEGSAIEGLQFSANNLAFFEGPEKEEKWSWEMLAFYALLADVEDELERQGFLVNNL